MLEDLHTEHSGEVLRGVLDASSSEVLLVNPSRRMLRTLVGAFREQPPPSVRLLADSDPLYRLTENFLTASTLADLVAGGKLGVRLFETVPRHSLAVTPETVVSVVEHDGKTAGLSTTEESFVRATRAVYDRRWEQAEEFAVQTPPLSELRETLGEALSERAVADFDRILEATRDDSSHLDGVTAILLVAAHNDELLYDVGQWSERVGLASKATVSRTKNILEDRGILDTEKVPIDVGRPRQRLHFADPALGDAPIEEIVRYVQTNP